MSMLSSPRKEPLTSITGMSASAGSSSERVTTAAASPAGRPIESSSLWIGKTFSPSTTWKSASSLRRCVEVQPRAAAARKSRLTHEPYATAGGSIRSSSSSGSAPPARSATERKNSRCCSLPRRWTNTPGVGVSAATASAFFANSASSVVSRTRRCTSTPKVATA